MWLVGGAITHCAVKDSHLIATEDPQSLIVAQSVAAESSLCILIITLLFHLIVLLEHCEMFL